LNSWSGATTRRPIVAPRVRTRNLLWILNMAESRSVVGRRCCDREAAFCPAVCTVCCDSSYFRERSLYYRTSPRIRILLPSEAGVALLTVCCLSLLAPPSAMQRSTVCEHSSQNRLKTRHHAFIYEIQVSSSFGTRKRNMYRRLVVSLNSFRLLLSMSWLSLDSLE